MAKEASFGEVPGRGREGGEGGREGRTDGQMEGGEGREGKEGGEGRRGIYSGTPHNGHPSTTAICDISANSPGPD